MKLKSILVLLIISLLPGCFSRYSNWTVETFTGGVRIAPDCTKAQEYLCSMSIYDELQTIGLFNVLWLSPDVRAEYTKIYGNRRCLNCQGEEALLKTELKKACSYFEFLILMPIESYDTLATPTDNLPTWTISLLINGKCYQPDIVKKIKFEPEYKYLFGHQFSRYRQQYQAIFDIPLDENICNIQVTISSTKYRVCCGWQKTPDGWKKACPS